MKIFAVIGESGSGKTRLIRRLIPELKKRGFSAAVIKHCAHGFDLDVEGKDSWQMMKAGAAGVAMVSPDRLAILRKTTKADALPALAARHFGDTDFVVIEGGYGIKGLKTIEVMAKASRAKTQSDPRDLVAVVSRSKVEIGRPVFRPGQVGEIADFLVSDLPAVQMPVVLEVDGRAVTLNPFVQNLIENIVVALARSLHGIGEGQIVLSVTRRKGPAKKRR
jgi:molybdopterin-guanine dinucleotide biosynthesis protein B